MASKGGFRDGEADHAGVRFRSRGLTVGSLVSAGHRARGDVAKTTTITLGDWSTSLTLDSSAPYTLYTYDVVTTGGQLSFADDDAGNQAIGNVLDNVSLSSATSATQSVADPVPELSTWGMILLGFAGLAHAAYRRTNRDSVVRAA